MKKQFFSTSLIYFVTAVVACLLNLAVSAMIVKILDLFIIVDYFIAAVTRTAVAFLVVPGVVGAISFYDSYKKVEFRPGYVCATVATGGAMHLALSIVLMFYPFVAGGTRYLAGLINMGNNFDSAQKVADIYLWAYLGSFAIYLAAEIAAAVLCSYLGKKKRIDNRKDIEGYSQGA